MLSQAVPDTNKKMKTHLVQQVDPYLGNQTIQLCDTVDGRNPAPVDR